MGSLTETLDALLEMLQEMTDRLANARAGLAESQGRLQRSLLVCEVEACTFVGSFLDLPCRGKVRGPGGCSIDCRNNDFF